MILVPQFQILRLSSSFRFLLYRENPCQQRHAHWQLWCQQLTPRPTTTTTTTSRFHCWKKESRVKSSSASSLLGLHHTYATHGSASTKSSSGSSNQMDATQSMARESCPAGLDTDSSKDDMVAIQRERALDLWSTVRQSLHVAEDVVSTVTDRLKRGLVPPVFHAYSSLYHRNIMGKKKEIEMIEINPKLLPSIEPVTTGTETSPEAGKILGKENFMDAFFTTNGNAREKVQDYTSTFWRISAEDVCQLINMEAEMIGADVEITIVHSEFCIGTVHDSNNTHLITRPLSRGVVAECLSMPAEGTRAIVGCTGIGKSWTLVYALQQLLLVNGACVLFLAAKACRAFVYIRRDDKIYAWERSADTATSDLFHYENVWVLLDPREANCGSTQFAMGKRRLLIAATNEDMHFASSMLKENPKALNYLDPFTKDEVRVALPVMASTKVFNEKKVLTWASKVGMLPRCLINKSQFEYRLGTFDHAVNFLNSDKVWDLARSRGISSRWAALPDLVFAVCAARDVAKDGVKVPIGYDGQSGVIYTERSLSVLSEYVWTEFTRKDHDLRIRGSAREFLLALWGAVDVFEFSKQWKDVKNLLRDDLRAGAMFRTWDMKRKKYVLPPTPPKSTKHLIYKDGQIAQLKIVFDRNDLLLSMMPDCPIIDFAGPGRKVYKVTVGCDHTIPLNATAELLAAAGYMDKHENGKFVTVPCDPFISQPKLDFYWVVPSYGKYFNWKEKNPITFTQKNEDEVNKALDMYVNQYVLLVDDISPSVESITELVATQVWWGQKAVVVTGKFKGFSKEQVQTMAYKMGAVIQQDIEQSTTLVIKGSSNVSNALVDNARKMNIPVMEEEEFLDIFQQ